MSNVYNIHFTNHGYSAYEEPSTLGEAKEIARKAGFESGIWEIDDRGDIVRLVLLYSPITGFREYR